MGDNEYGQLGLAALSKTNTPQLIVASNVIAVAAGYEHSLFLKQDGSLWGMGNTGGALGDGTYNNTNRPEMIVASNVTAIAAGPGYSLFLRTMAVFGEWGTTRMVSWETPPKQHQSSYPNS